MAIHIGRLNRVNDVKKINAIKIILEKRLSTFWLKCRATKEKRAVTRLSVILDNIQRRIVGETEIKNTKPIPIHGFECLLDIASITRKTMSSDKDGITSIPGIPSRKTKGTERSG